MCQASFDGDIFKYKLRNVFKVLYSLVGLNKQIEIPINIVLHYQKKEFWFGVTTLEFFIERTKYGVSHPNPVKVRKMLFIGDKRMLIESLQSRIDNNVQLSLQGINVGLSHLRLESIRAFYSRENLSTPTQSKEQKISRSMSFRQYRLGQPVNGI